MTDASSIWGDNNDLVLNEMEYYRWKGQYELLKESKNASFEQEIDMIYQNCRI